MLYTDVDTEESFRKEYIQLDILIESLEAYEKDGWVCTVFQNGRVTIRKKL